MMELSYKMFKYFVLISSNNTMNPTFFPGPNTPQHNVSLHAILWHVKIKHSKFSNEKDF